MRSSRLRYSSAPCGSARLQSEKCKRQTHEIVDASEDFINRAVVLAQELSIPLLRFCDVQDSLRNARSKLSSTVFAALLLRDVVDGQVHSDVLELRVDVIANNVTDDLSSKFRVKTQLQLSAINGTSILRLVPCTPVTFFERSTTCLLATLSANVPQRIARVL